MKDEQTNIQEFVDKFNTTKFPINSNQLAIEIASKLRSSDGVAMTVTELEATAERILKFINKS